MTANHTNNKQIHFPKCLCVEIFALIGHISCVLSYLFFYLTPAFKMKVIYNCIIDCVIDNLGESILMICLRFHAIMK